MINRYIGTLEGTGGIVVGAHTLIPKEQRHIGSTIDALTSNYGPNPAVATPEGWIVRMAARDVTSHEAFRTLAPNGEPVNELGVVTMGQIESVLGVEGLQRYFQTQSE